MLHLFLVPFKMDYHSEHVRQYIIVGDFESLPYSWFGCRSLVKCLQEGCFEPVHPAFECVGLKELVNMFKVILAREGSQNVIDYQLEGLTGVKVLR